ncbi:unnamed protein product [Acanthoscelides obtectus]|uniref:Uncharacterized protein n=1 Tax=Acanthoscelides obtectus TaxID=200917 RepID=A0A9P0JRU0_ACAOB|nr:unnamed protein product [Acanthoscelides obtectus]CAK1668136.1 hypothetical protein AOBTE_LOCUS26250 [Acanthoscelides obtectus]
MYIAQLEDFGIDGSVELTAVEQDLLLEEFGEAEGGLVIGMQLQLLPKTELVQEVEAMVYTCSMVVHRLIVIEKVLI